MIISWLLTELRINDINLRSGIVIVCSDSMSVYLEVKTFLDLGITQELTLVRVD